MFVLAHLSKRCFILCISAAVNLQIECVRLSLWRAWSKSVCTLSLSAGVSVPTSQPFAPSLLAMRFPKSISCCYATFADTHYVPSDSNDSAAASAVQEKIAPSNHPLVKEHRFVVALALVVLTGCRHFHRHHLHSNKPRQSPYPVRSIFHANPYGKASVGDQQRYVQYWGVATKTGTTVSRRRGPAGHYTICRLLTCIVGPCRLQPAYSASNAIFPWPSPDERVLRSTTITGLDSNPEDNFTGPISYSSSSFSVY